MDVFFVCLFLFFSVSLARKAWRTWCVCACTVCVFASVYM